ncbi:MAG: glycosyltransferase [Bacteroidales bacterium]|nr:glycosyltransferase [Bacteroidales bacterium]
MYWLLTVLLPYVLIFLFLRIRQLQEDRKPEESTGNKRQGPKLLSLIIPLRNEEANIKNLVNDLADQSLEPGLFEAIFVDDASTDSTVEILRSSSGLLHRSLILSSSGAGKKKAIALGIENAGGDYIVTTDGDCRAGENWLKEICERLVRTNADMIIGPVDIIDSGGLLNRIIQLEFLALQAVTEILARHGKPLMCNGANLCFRKPGADEYEAMVKTYLPSGDDIFLMESFIRQGKEILWIDSPGATVQTHGPYSLKSFLKQRLRWTSKSPFYSDYLLIAIAALVFFSNMFIVACFIASFFFPGLWVIFFSLLIMKSVPDLMLLSPAAAKRGKKKLLLLFFPVQLFYPFYVTLTGTAGLLKGLFSSPQNR